MRVLVIEQLRASELPQEWARELRLAPEQIIKLRVEAQLPPDPSLHLECCAADDSAFGIWRDRTDIADVEDYVRVLRTARGGYR